MRRFLPIMLLAVATVFTIGVSGCATKKYVRTTVNERVTPLEGRTQELEETVRRSTQEIRDLDDRLSKRIDDVTARTDRAQSTADSANARAAAADDRAGRADERAGQVETRVETLRENLDRYTRISEVSVNFRLNSALLSSEAKAQLDAIANESKNHKGYIMEIHGLTDSTGSSGYNDKLSQERAAAVQRYLAREHQIPTFKMSMVGLGEANEEGITEAGVSRREMRLRNRRVDVLLLINNAVNVSNAENATLKP